MIYVYIEEEFKAFDWCDELLSGLYKELKKRRMEYKVLPVLGENLQKSANIIIVGATLKWIEKAVYQCNRLQIHPIVMGNQHPKIFGGQYSSVSTDIEYSMLTIVSYLQELKKANIVLYGVNPNSPSDIWRKKAFEKVCPDGAVYVTETGLSDLYEKFSSVQKPDAIICTNDYAAIMLIKRLGAEYDPKKLYIVSYSNTALAERFKPSITSVSNNFKQFGKAAIEIVEQLRKNEGLETLNYYIKTELVVRETTECKAIAIPPRVPSDNLNGNQFYEDEHIHALSAAEKIFKSCDDVDLQILNLILKGKSTIAISDQCFLSISAVKYRIQKIMKNGAVESRQELIDRIQQYL